MIHSSFPDPFFRREYLFGIGGCTKYLQPLDLTVNRSFKSRLRRGYAKSMREYTGKYARGTVSKVNMRQLSENVLRSANEVTRECVLNGWRKMKEAKSLFVKT